MRFVHIADVHLDTSFAGRSETVRRRLRRASREAFAAAVDLAVHEEVHALLVAGDLFDGDRLSFQTERFLLEQAARLGEVGITMVYATGNHDPGGGAGGYRRIEWPAHVVVADDATPVRVPIRRGDPTESAQADRTTVGYVTAIGHATRAVTDDLSRRFPPPEGTLPEVALLHTQVRSSRGSERHDPYAPSDLAHLARAGFDYWALGHVHVRQTLSDHPPIVYPGNLQGRTPTDTGPRGGLLVDLSDADRPRIDFHELAPVRWETLVLESIDEAGTLDRLVHASVAAWHAARGEDSGAPGTEWMVRIVLRGATPLWRELESEENRSELAEELASALDALDVEVVADGLHPPVDLEEHRARPDVLGEALRMLGAIRSGALRLEGIPPEALAGVRSPDPNAVAGYVRELLAEADGEVATRLLAKLDGTGS